MSRPLLTLLVLDCLFVGILGFFWLHQPSSNQELLANYAKVADYASAAISVGGLPWWTPNYLQGCSLAFLSLGALANLALLAGALVAGPYLGTKLAALAFLFLCPLTMFAFARRLCPGSGWTGFSCAAAYLFAPPVLLRLGHVEHVANVLAFAMIPLAFRGVLIFLEERTAWSAIQCAVMNSLLVLAYAKIAVIVLPLLGAFGLWAWIARAHFNAPSGWNILICLAAFALLAGLPNLPALRETRFVAKFAFGPFEGWQTTYSAESALSWLDRNGGLTGARPSRQSEVAASSSYLGLTGIACATALFFLRKRAVWLRPDATVFRVFVALTFLAHWLGLGVNTAWSGQFAFLSHSGLAWDPAIAISWGLLILQGVAIWIVIPGSLPARRGLTALALVVYFLVPGFRLIERLPLYGGIRAPRDFFEMGGVFCFSVAAGNSAALLAGEIRSIGARIATIAAMLGLASADSASVVTSFFKGPLDRKTFDDFLAAQKFLRTGAPGRLAAYSGRYFYLLTPLLSGRGLVTEAFGSQFMLRGVARLQQAALQSKQDYATFLDIAGVSHLLIDKKDPDTPVDLQEALKLSLRPVSENEHFDILENPDSYYPAAFAKDFLPFDEQVAQSASNVLGAAAQGVPALSRPGASPADEGLLRWDANLTRATKMRKASADEISRKNAQEIVIHPPAETGWLIIPEAAHPDWRATQENRVLQIAEAYGAYLAIRLNGTPTGIRLSFRPPWWYGACVWTTLAGWCLAASLLLAGKFQLLPEAFYACLHDRGSRARPAQSSNTTRRIPAGKVLVVIPTYNEASGIVDALDKTLAASPKLEVLVVDDGSPDETARIVRSHSAFNRRLHLLERRGRRGLGSAYKEGFRWAIARAFDVCIQIDADLSHNPADIPRLLSAIEGGADAAIGSRYLGGVRVINWPQDRLFLSLGASKLVRALTGLPLTDVTSGFKAIRCTALRDLDWGRFVTEGYGFQVELHYFLWKSGRRLIEIPIVFTERRSGETKMTFRIAVEAAQRVLRLAIFKK